jgi:hypothetical protein
MEDDPRIEAPEDKDLQDHKFGMTAAADQEQAEELADDPAAASTDRRPEPEAGGKAPA